MIDDTERKTFLSADFADGRRFKKKQDAGLL
jgi:hypothetical protein